MNFNSFSFNKILLSIKLTEDQKRFGWTYFTYFYGGIVGMATIYGMKKGTQKWLEWKQTRHYKKMTNDSLESIVDIACDGGTLAFYAMTCAICNAFIASIAPISVPILHYYRLDKGILPKTFSTDSICSSESDNSDEHNSEHNF